MCNDLTAARWRAYTKYTAHGWHADMTLGRRGHQVKSGRMRENDDTGPENEDLLRRMKDY